MKNAYIFLAYILMAQSNVVFAQRSNCSAYPDIVNVSQPNGTALELYIKGNEVFHYYQTTNGYTVLQNPQNNGQYEYATKSIGGEIVPSGIAVGQPFNQSDISQGLKPSTNQIKQAFTKFMGNIPAEQFNKAGNSSLFPSQGKRKLLVVLMQFPNEAAIYPKQNIEDMMSEPGYSNYGCAGSFRDFYLDNSNGQLDLDITVLGWYTASRPRLEYGKTDAQGNDNPDYNDNVQELIGEAIDYANNDGIDFSDYDNDNDGIMDGLVVFHSGFGAEQSKNGYIWSHRWTLFGNNDRFYDGVTIRDYCINPLKRDFNGTTQVRVGVISHEFGHVLGLPDLYDVDYKSRGAGNWCLMSGGGWLNNESTPCQHSTWCKSELGWLNPTQITTNGKFVLPNNTDSNVAFKVTTPVSKEYFLLENRQPKKWDKYLPGRGLAIWHIDDNKALDYRLFNSNDVNTDTAQLGVGLKQADGLRELERDINSGNAGDLYPGPSNKSVFTKASSPNSNLHTKNNNGNQIISDVTLVNITQEADSTISFNFGGLASAYFVPSLISGCAPVSVNFTNQSVYASSYKWLFGNGQTSTQPNPTTTYALGGKYTASLIALNSQDLPVDTYTVNIAVTDAPKANFSYTRNGDTVSFQNLSSGATNYKWLFGNGFTSTATNPQSVLFTKASVVTLIAFSGNCTDTIKGNVWKTGLKNIDNNPLNIAVFPNPITEKSILSFELMHGSDVVISIYNMLGKELYRELLTEVSPGKQELSLSNKNTLKAGMYFLKLSANGQESIQRIIKQ